MYYDFHLHSCLSPCADNEMTPYNIVNLAKLLGYDAIAITDHNTAGNCNSAIKAGDAIGLKVFAGMELCTVEEIHMIFIFKNAKNAEEFGKYIYGVLPKIKNNPQIYGNQFYVDEYDNILGEEDAFLIGATDVSIEDTLNLAREYNAVCYPAHIDRDSFSILSSFGYIPPELNFEACEISFNADVNKLAKKNPILNNMEIIRASDSHYLENMPMAKYSMQTNNSIFAQLFY